MRLAKEISGVKMVRCSWHKNGARRLAMTERPKKNDSHQFLSGWKEIANYLGKGVRTVQRYEMQLQLPVRRPAGKPWGSVVATKAELDAWVKASPIRDVFRLSVRNAQDGYAGPADEIKRGLATMMQLRDQMLALRAEVRKSVGLLRNSVHELQGELNQNRYRDLAWPAPSLDDKDIENNQDEFPGLDEFDLLAAPMNYPKAS